MKKSCFITIPKIVFIMICFLTGCKSTLADFYTKDDFQRVDKIDTHFHYDTFDPRYLEFADSLNFRLISPNVDAGMPIEEQLRITSLIKRQFPEKFAFFGTFSIDGFGKTGFSENAVAYIDKCMKSGASGIKIWKNIGMVLKDSAGRYVMVDDPGFDSIYNYMEANHIPVIGHIGEPRNCWLPEKEMTVDNDRRYYLEHPEYYMYMHPEAPSYEDQINARDNLLKKHPDLQFIGAHLASIEWSVDELAKRLDRFPKMTVDLAGRIGNVQHQSLADREKVRNFLIKYQDRILYATDGIVTEQDTNYVRKTSELKATWMNHWIYLATDSSMVVPNLGGQKVKGLQLPREVIDKIYHKNAERFFKSETPMKTNQ